MGDCELTFIALKINPPLSSEHIHQRRRIAQFGADSAPTTYVVLTANT